jgi:hypothetical protein
VYLVFAHAGDEGFWEARNYQIVCDEVWAVFHPLSKTISYARGCLEENQKTRISGLPDYLMR